MKKIFIAATKQNDGKTTVALGLIANFQKIFNRIGFIKPVGQRYLEDDGVKIDEDSILIKESFKLYGVKSSIKDMSPVAVERGFTERYIIRPNPKGITKNIRDSFGRVSQGQELVVIEGTGHAGVGSVFDHSNARVARLLGSKVIIVSSGGIGRPIDEIVLNRSLFEKEGVKILGAIVNKVMPDKFEKINDLVRRGLRRKGIDVLGVIPYNPMLSYPTIKQILEETDFKLLFGSSDNSLNNSVGSIVIGAMQPRDAAKYIKDHSLIITPGDREDIIKLVLDFCSQGRKISGIILSGDMMPEQDIADSLKCISMPVMLARQDTYTVALLIHDLIVKIRPADREKVETVKQMVRDYVDLPMITERL